MGKRYVRYFCGFIDAQRNWLNSMSSKGYRLVHTDKLIFEFEECEPNKYCYCVDFVAHKSNKKMKDYKNFLEQIGYKVITKNANLNWSIGKIRFRPYGDGAGKIATSPGNYNKELLIVEKLNDSRPFELHTTTEDKILYYKSQKNAYASILLICAVIFLYKLFTMKQLTFSNGSILVLGMLFTFPTLAFQRQIWNIKKHTKLNE